MKFNARFAIFMLLLVLVDFAIYAVLTVNYDDGVYPVDADSLAIPFMETAFLTLVAIGLFLLTSVASSFGPLHQRAQSSAVWLYITAALMAIGYLASAAFLALWGWSWAAPNHYSIVVVFSLAAVFVVCFGAVELYRLRPNNSFKPKPLRGSA